MTALYFFLSKCEPPGFSVEERLARRHRHTLREGDAADAGRRGAGAAGEAGGAG